MQKICLLSIALLRRPYQIISLAFICLTLLPGLAACGNNGAAGNSPDAVQQGKSTGAWQSIRMLDAQNGWASTWQSILRTNDGGKTWKDVTPWSKLSPWGHPATFVSANIAWVVQQGNKDDNSPAHIYRTVDGGQTWQGADIAGTVSTFSFTRHDVTVGDISSTGPNNAWAIVTSIASAMRSDNITTDYVHVIHTVDGGKTWNVALQTLPGAANLLKNEPGLGSWVSFFNTQTGWVASASPFTIAMTHDGGQSWQIQHLPSPVPALSQNELALTHNGTPIFIDAQHGMLQLLTYIGNTTRRIFYITRDGGRSWQIAATLQVEGSSAVTFADANHWYIPAMDEQYKTTMLYVTADGGRHWSTMPTKLAYQRLGSLNFLTPTTGWAIGDNTNLKGAFAGNSDTVTAPLFTSDGGKTWMAIAHTVD